MIETLEYLNTIHITEKNLKYEQNLGNGSLMHEVAEIVIMPVHHNGKRLAQDQYEPHCYVTQLAPHPV